MYALKIQYKQSR